MRKKLDNKSEKRYNKGRRKRKEVNKMNKIKLKKQALHDYRLIDHADKAEKMMTLIVAQKKKQGHSKVLQHCVVCNGVKTILRS